MRSENGDRDRLTWLLQRHTDLPVRTARPGMPALAHGVTVIPGGFAATIDTARQICLTQTRAVGGDDLLTSAAAKTGPGGSDRRGADRHAARRGGGR
jgi:hypothetical protein